MADQNEKLVIVGAGPAGLATAGVARELGVDALVLERADVVGGAWPRMRPGMRCLSLRHHDRMPDGSSPSARGDRASAGDVARWLADYARRERLRIELGVTCERLCADTHGFTLTTSTGPVRASRLVVATGEYGQPRIPQFSGAFAGKQCHSSALDLEVVRAGEHVVVVGSANSAAEVVGLLLAKGARVTVAARSGIERPAGIARGLVGELRWLASAVPLKYMEPFDALRSRFVPGVLMSDDVICGRNTPVVDRTLADARDRGAIAVVGEVFALHEHGIRCRDGSDVRCDRIVWATGFVRETAWLRDMITCDTGGVPRHDQGVSAQWPGLGFVGIPCQRTRRSGFIRGFAGDARHVLGRLV